MLALPVNNEVSIYNYQQKILSTFMYGDGVYKIRPLN